MQNKFWGCRQQVKKKKNQQEKEKNDIEPALSERWKTHFALLCPNLPGAQKMWGTVLTLIERSMEHINRIELLGRVGTVRANEHNGSKVANFTMITDFLYKSRDGQAVDESMWHNIVAWSGKDIPDLDRIVKGADVHVIGRLRINRYTSAEGVEKQYYEVMASKVRILGGEGN